MFPSTIYVTFFADKCLKKNLLIDIYAMYYAESKKMHRLAYTLKQI